MSTYTIRAKRERLGLTQAQFWNPLGVTQSGGSRFELGRPMPEPVKNLLAIAYGDEKQANAVVTLLRKWTPT